jgi:hypothetical protein
MSAATDAIPMPAGFEDIAAPVVRLARAVAALQWRP